MIAVKYILKMLVHQHFTTVKSYLRLILLNITDEILRFHYFHIFNKISFSSIFFRNNIKEQITLLSEYLLLTHVRKYVLFYMHRMFYRTT